MIYFYVLELCLLTIFVSIVIGGNPCFWSPCMESISLSWSEYK